MNSPTSTFTAINPPDWLKSDIALAEQKLPEIRTLVLFAGDLPRANRMEGIWTDERDSQFRLAAFHDLVEGVWGYSFQAAGFETKHQGIALHIEGAAQTNQTYSELYKFNELTGDQEIHRRPLQPPSHAVIMLADRDLSVSSSTALHTRMPRSLCARIKGVIPHRFTFWHELAHLKAACNTEQFITYRVDETAADRLGKSGCLLSGDETSASYGIQRRELSSFLSPTIGKATRYWNILSQEREISEADELAAYLEVKLRGVPDAPAIEGTPAQFARACFMEPQYHRLRQFTEADWFPCEERLRMLKAGRKTPYIFPHSEELAERVLEAAHRLVPAVFRPQAA